MKTWILTAVILGILLLGVVAASAISSNGTVETDTKVSSCSSCGNACTAGNNCGLATCGAVNGGKCTCGKK